jgi:hypothetical protein
MTLILLSHDSFFESSADSPGFRPTGGDFSDGNIDFFGLHRSLATVWFASTFSAQPDSDSTIIEVVPTSEKWSLGVSSGKMAPTLLISMSLDILCSRSFCQKCWSTTSLDLAENISDRFSESIAFLSDHLNLASCW